MHLTITFIFVFPFHMLQYVTHPIHMDLVSATCVPAFIHTQPLCQSLFSCTYTCVHTLPSPSLSPLYTLYLVKFCNWGGYQKWVWHHVKQGWRGKVMMLVMRLSVRAMEIRGSCCQWQWQKSKTMNTKVKMRGSQGLWLGTNLQVVRGETGGSHTFHTTPYTMIPRIHFL